MKFICQPIIFCIFIILSTNYSFAQINLDCNDGIIEAENFVIQGQMENALKSYSAAFSDDCEVYAKDIDNALNCAIDLGEFDKAIQLSRKLIKLGCTLDYFRNQESLSLMISSSGWLDLIKSYPKLRSEYLENVNQSLRSKIEELFHRDQYWRGRDPYYGELKDSTFYEDSLIMGELEVIFKQYGYPNENEIGLFFQNDTTIAYSPIQLIIIHNYNSADNYKVGPNWTELLNDQRKLGKLPSHSFAYLNDRSGDYRIDKGGFVIANILWVFDGKYYIEKRSDEKVNIINSLRIKYGLETLDESIQKALFQIRVDSRFDFFHASFVSSTYLPAELIEKLFSEVPGLK